MSFLNKVEDSLWSVVVLKIHGFRHNKIPEICCQGEFDGSVVQKVGIFDA